MTPLEIAPAEGFVYVLTNPCLPGFVKIGMSTVSAESRAANMNSSTGVPPSYTVYHTREVSQPYTIETLVKRKLKKFRLAKSEIFNLPAAYAREIVDMVVDGTDSATQHRDPSVLRNKIEAPRILKSAGDLGAAIKKERRTQGLTQEQLAGACGLGVRFVRELEAGKPTIQMDKALEVVSGLGLTVVVGRKGAAFPIASNDNAPAKEAA